MKKNGKGFQGQRTRKTSKERELILRKMKSSINDFFFGFEKITRTFE